MPDTTPSPIRVAIIEDNSAYRKAVGYALSEVDDIETSGSWSSWETARPDLEKKETPHVLLMDLGLPGIGGLEAIPLIRKINPSIQVLVLTEFDDKPKVFQAISEGASGYLLKTGSVDEIITGIREVVAGGAPLNARIARMVLTTFSKITPRDPDTILTARETEVLKLLSEGFIKKEAADQLDISYHTVDMHVRNIYQKLQVHNLSGAVSKAIKRGLL